jgi:hypothetical protein
MTPTLLDDYEFIEFMQELVLAPDTVIKREYMARMLNILKQQDREIVALKSSLKRVATSLNIFTAISAARKALGAESIASYSGTDTPDTGGYQPQGSSKPEGQNPPTGGSNVSNAPQISNNSEKLRQMPDDIIATLQHARIFITTREKMNPVGVQLYDELIDRLVEIKKGNITRQIAIDNEQYIP